MKVTAHRPEWRTPDNVFLSFSQITLVAFTIVHCFYYISRSDMVVEVVELLQRHSHRGHVDVGVLAAWEQVRASRRQVKAERGEMDNICSFFCLSCRQAKKEQIFNVDWSGVCFPSFNRTVNFTTIIKAYYPCKTQLYVCKFTVLFTLVSPWFVVFAEHTQGKSSSEAKISCRDLIVAVTDESSSCWDISLFPQSICTLRGIIIFLLVMKCVVVLRANKTFATAVTLLACSLSSLVWPVVNTLGAWGMDESYTLVL